MVTEGFSFRTDFFRNLDKLRVRLVTGVKVDLLNKLFCDDPRLVRVSDDLPVHGPIQCWWRVSSEDITIKELSPDLTSTHLAEQLSLVLVWPLVLAFPLLTLALFCLRWDDSEMLTVSPRSAKAKLQFTERLSELEYVSKVNASDQK